MTIQQIPLNNIPAQSISIVLNNQQCIINLRELNERQYLSLSMSGTPLCQNILLQNNSPIVLSAYSGFVGELYVEDLQGNDYPQYSGWGSRWVLLYNVN